MVLFILECLRLKLLIGCVVEGVLFGRCVSLELEDELSHSLVLNAVSTASAQLGRCPAFFPASLNREEEKIRLTGDRYDDSADTIYRVKAKPVVPIAGQTNS